jgi:hypothetical protein
MAAEVGMAEVVGVMVVVDVVAEAVRGGRFKYRNRFIFVLYFVHFLLTLAKSQPYFFSHSFQRFF